MRRESRGKGLPNMRGLVAVSSVTKENVAAALERADRKIYRANLCFNMLVYCSDGKKSSASPTQKRLEERMF